MKKTLLRPFEALDTAWIRLNNFQKARWKLTGMYLFLLFCILNIFAGVLFVLLHYEEASSAKHIETKWEQKKIVFPEQNITIMQWRQSPVEVPLGKQEILDLQHIFVEAIVEWMFLVEFVLLLLSGILSYILAGKTLAPIQEKNKQQEQFLADVSHELKNPLSALSMSVEMAKQQKKWTPAELLEFFTDIEEELKRLIKTTDDLLLLERKQEIPLPKKECHIEKIVQSVLHTLSAFAQSKNVTLQKNLSPVTVLAHEEDIEKIIFNLVHNAIKFSPPNEKVSVTLSSDGTFSVNNFGDPLPKKDIPFLFDRFWKSDASRTFHTENGSGLGLSLVKKICDAYKWGITVKSTPKQGTFFTVHF